MPKLCYPINNHIDPSSSKNKVVPLVFFFSNDATTLIFGVHLNRLEKQRGHGDTSAGPLRSPLDTPWTPLDPPRPPGVSSNDATTLIFGVLFNRLEKRRGHGHTSAGHFDRVTD